MPICHEERRFSVRLPRTGGFPIDMLRFDEAYPASIHDGELIRMLCQQDEGELRDLPVMVEIRLGSRKEFCPTAKRWESFGVHVVEPIEA